MAPQDDSTVIEEETVAEQGVEPDGSQDDIEADETEPEGVEDQVEETEEQAEEAEPLNKRFTQFEGDTYEEYVPKLEEAYANSQTEAQRIMSENKDLRGRLDQITQLVAQNPQVAAQLTGQQNATAGEVLTNPNSPISDPALMFWRSEYERRNTDEYNTFVQDHPEIVSDPTLNQQVLDRLSVLANTIRQSEGRQIGMKEGLELAWTSLGKPLESKEEKVGMAAKQSAATSRASSGPSAAPRRSEQPRFTSEQVKVAKMMYPDLSDKELLEKLAEHNPV